MSSPAADTTKLIIAAFIIERVTRGILFLMSYVRGWSKTFPERRHKSRSGNTPAEKNGRLIYFIFAGLIAAGILFAYWRRFGLLFGVQGRLAAAGIWVLLLAGSDQLASLLDWGVADQSEDGAEKPIEITGTIHVTVEEIEKSAGAGAGA